MPREVNPTQTSRASAWALWMKAPNPMVTFFKTLDVTNLIRVSRRRRLKFNMLMGYCIGKAAAEISDCVTSYDLKKLPEMLAYYAEKGCEVRPLGEYQDMT